jgi:hypothetical protein
MNRPALIIDPHPVIAFRQGPGCAYEAFPPLARLNPIVIYDLLGKNEVWWQVDLCNNEIGWIFSPSVALNNRMGDLDALPEVPAPPITSNPSLQEADPKKPFTQTSFTVVRDCQGFFWVIDWPPYEMYGG